MTCYDNLEAHVQGRLENVQGEHTFAAPSASFALLCAARCSLLAFALEAFCVISVATFSSAWLFDDKVPMCPSPSGASAAITAVSSVWTNASSLEACLRLQVGRNREHLREQLPRSQRPVSTQRHSIADGLTSQHGGKQSSRSSLETNQSSGNSRVGIPVQFLLVDC
jgi:hypothetical protein